MQRIVVTGSPEAVGPAVAAIEAAGAEAVGLDDPARLVDQLRALEPGSVSCYVQLPVALVPGGTTAVSRLHSFLEQGLLTRFVLADAVLPALAPDAAVVLVGGHSAADQHMPDDREARRSLLVVLAHAVHADRAPATTRVRVLAHDASPQDVANAALGREEPADDDTPSRSPEQRRAYADWRTELVGLGMAEY
jgi:hypothetical protein